METKFKNKYRIKSNRLKNWDYSSEGHYYVTICTYGRKYSFGNIINDEMILSETGKIAEKYWRDIRNHFPFIELDEFVIMPNHVHGIIVINNKNDNIMVETPHWGVSTGIKHKSLPIKNISSTTPGGHKYQWKSNSLGSIINQFKSICTKRIRQSHDIDFKWQPRFYDHIIRNDESLQRIREYIANNPANWQEDKEYVSSA